jgi:hypothetical protein
LRSHIRISALLCSPGGSEPHLYLSKLLFTAGKPLSCL